MSDIRGRRPLALTATLATSVAAATGLLAPVAHATNASPDPTTPARLTLSTGGGQVSVIGGDAISTPDGSGGVAWSSDGSRFAYVNSTDDVVVAAPGGTRVRITPPNSANVVRSHPTWIHGGAQIMWAEKAGNGRWTLKYAYASGMDGTLAVPGVHDFGTPQGDGDYEFPDAAGSMLVYQFSSAAGREIYVQDGDGTAPYQVAWGQHPSISPDQSRIAFVHADNSATPLDQIWYVPAGKPGADLAKPVQVTANTAPLSQIAHFAHPVWSPDGTTIAYEQRDANYADVDVKLVDVATKTETQVTPGHAAQGLPAWQTMVKNSVVRLAGADRADTAVKVSQAHWASAGSQARPELFAKAVVLTRADDFADALGGSALAAKVGGPLLLTPTAGVSQPVRDEIARVLGPGDGAKTVYVLGGEKALSPAVAATLTGLGYRVQRISGPDRYATAVAIAGAVTGPGVAPDYVLVATGQKFPDALAAGAAAGAIDAERGKNAVVLLTDEKQMPKATADYLTPLNARAVRPSIVSVGFQAEDALRSSWLPAGTQLGGFLPLSGADRYETSYLVARQFFGSTRTVGLSTGLGWADALSGGALMGTYNGPMLLVDPKNGPTDEAKTWLADNSGQLDSALILGGTTAVSGSVDHEVGRLISGPAGTDYPRNPRTS
jgi:putative cell wall-binding protein